MQKIINYFKEHGEKLEPRGNKPILLNEGNHVYLVAEGSIDIFSIKSRDNLPASARKYILRLTPYRLFLDSNHKQYDSSEILMAVGNSTTVVYRIGKQAFSKILKMDNYLENAFWLLEEWLNVFLYRVFMPFQAQDYIDFSITNELSVDENKYVMSKNRFIWIKHIEGQSAVCGDVNVLIDNTTIFPVSENIYIKTLVNSKFEKFTSQDLFNQDQYWDMLDHCFVLALNKISLLRKRYIEQERKRINGRSILKQITLKKSIFKIANILQPKSKKTLEEQLDVDTDELLACCNLIGKNLNVKFSLPSSLSDGLNNKEKLTEIVRASRVRTRKVLLDMNWWHSDSGALLSFNKENNHPIALIPKSPGQYYFIDLVLKEKLLINNEVAKRLEDFAYFFYRLFPDKALSWWDLVKFGTFRNFGDLITIFLVGIAGALLGLLNPYLTGKLFGSIIPSASMNELNQMVYILFSAAIAIAVFELTRSIAMLRFEGKMDRDLQAALWDRLLSLPVPFFKRYTSGDLANRSLGISQIRQVISGITIQSLLTGIFSVFYLIQLFSYNLNLAMLALMLGGAILLIAAGIGYIFVSFQLPINEIEGKISGTYCLI